MTTLPLDNKQRYNKQHHEEDIFTNHRSLLSLLSGFILDWRGHYRCTERLNTV